MASFKCPFCQENMAVALSTRNEFRLSFSGQVSLGAKKMPDDCFRVEFYCCPNCENVAVYATGIGTKVENVNISIYPGDRGNNFPDYVPKAIQNDYQEAYSILGLSPKASATLARRCLQGMIHDFWEIDKGNLAKEIASLKEKVPPTQWNAINSMRSLGNIGAHMESDVNLIVDIDPGEASVLLRFIELLIEKWYIAREDERNLLATVVGIGDDKRSQRQGSL